MRKVVTITGGNSGIGRSTVELYLSKGYNVASYNKTIGNMAEIQRRYSEQFIEFEGNVKNTEALSDFYFECHKKWGSLDIVISNAAVANARKIEDLSEESFDDTFAVNVRGAFFTLQKSLAYLSSTASLTLISSIQANKGDSEWCAYGASKAAVRSMTRSFAQGLATKGVRVNCVSPGVTNTPIFKKMGIKKERIGGLLAGVAEATPLGRLGDPKEVSELIYFINSDAASFVTGADFQIDGGLTQI